MEKKTMLALALSLVVLIGFQIIMAKFYPQKAMPVQSRAILQEKVIEQMREQAKPEIIPVFSDEKEVVFANNLYAITFSDIGGGVKKVTLNKNPKNGLNIACEVFSAKSADKGLFLFFPDKFGSGLNNAKYLARQVEDGVIFTYTGNNELQVEKRYRLRNSLYIIELEVTFKNLKSSDIAREYSLISFIQQPTTVADERFAEIAVDLDGKIAKHKRQKRAFEIQKSGTLNWVMLKDRYFSLITRPSTPSFGYILKQTDKGDLFGATSIKTFSIPANSGVVHKFSVYLGPTDLNLLKETNIGAENALSYGVFGGISQLLISALRLFYKITRNWGVAIILLTILINIVLLPLTKKSYKSMQEMQILQPKIEKLRQECKNNPQKLQKETMELYKKYKVNPMAGCLPMILQMPIFIALYQGLMHSIELRGAKFLWIRDLSIPENVRLPFTLPLIGNTINILPILMLVAMFFQQRLSTKMTSMAQTDEQRQQQKIMAIMMTVMFGFIFYNFPSGLVLYWFGNTVIMTGFQMFFSKTPHVVVE